MNSQHTTFDLTELIEYQRRVQHLSTTEGIGELYKDVLQKLAGEFLNRVIKRTRPAEGRSYGYRTIGGGIAYKSNVPGTLRRGWTGGVDMPAETFIKTVPVHNTGRAYRIRVYNDTEYASYVEFGHRQNVGKFVPYIGEDMGEGEGGIHVLSGAKLKKTFVEGQYMMTKSQDEIMEMAPGICGKAVQDFMKKNL